MKPISLTVHCGYSGSGQPLEALIRASFDAFLKRTLSPPQSAGACGMPVPGNSRGSREAADVP